MKKTFTFILLTFLSLNLSINAIDITKVDRVEPTDVMFIDMATAAAKKSIASGGAPSGAVIILNGAWRSTGTPSGDKTAEEVAVTKSRLDKLNQAVIYTVNEPTTDVINMLESLGINAIYFVNGRDAAVAAGVYPSSAYDDSKLDNSTTHSNIYQIGYPDAEQLLKK